LITINQVLGPVGYIVAGPLFVHAGLHATYALVAALATAAALNFAAVALSSPAAPLAQEAA
jgi:hypothetical protein